MLEILFLGDVVGRPGRRAVARYLNRLRKEGGLPDLVVANAENASGGRGLSPETAEELRDAGVDVLTTGNHVWQDRTIVDYIEESSRVVRPLNFAPGAPGRGWTIVEARGGSVNVAVVNLIGRVFMGPADCPFRAVDAALAEIEREADVVLVDMHAEATSEKTAMGYFLDGRVSGVVGSHTHVQTADESILPKGTAYLSDGGMCGPAVSVLGIRPERVIDRFLDQMPNRFDLAAGPSTVQGVVLEVDPGTGRASKVRRVRENFDA